MVNNIGTGAIVALTLTSSVYIWNHKIFNSLQKGILLLLFIFPPAQWLGIIIVLIYHREKEKKSPNRLHDINLRDQKIKLNSLKSDLEKLRDQGILSETNYIEKINRLKKEVRSKQIENTSEYKQLQNLRSSGILTEVEFLEMLKKIKTKNAIDEIELNESNLLGTYVVEDLKYKFETKNKLLITNNKGKTYNHKWFIIDKHNIKIQFFLVSTTFKNVEININGFKYDNVEKTYYAKKMPQKVKHISIV